MPDKVFDLADVVADVPDGALVAFGGGGMQRKPMAAAQALAASDVSGLRVAVFLGGPEVDLLVGLGKVAELRFAYVGLDAMGLAPNFRRAREEGLLTAVEYSEYMLLTALEAAAHGVPFLPTRSGLGTSLLDLPTAPFATVDCPFTGETLVAVPALRPDVVFLHVNQADRRGNARIVGDPFADNLLARAGTRVYVVADEVVDTLPSGSSKDTVISRVWVTGVCKATRGAAFTGSFPDYPIDHVKAGEYVQQAGDAAWLREFVGSPNGGAL